MREDSNPRSHRGMPVFKTGTLNHSDTHPSMQSMETIPMRGVHLVYKMQALQNANPGKMQSHQDCLHYQKTPVFNISRAKD